MPVLKDKLDLIAPLLRDHRLFRTNPTFHNPDWESARFKVLILRLSPFVDVERSTPHLFLAREVRGALPDAFIDMAFLPLFHDARVLLDAGLPLIIGTQSAGFMADFDVILVSNSWLLEQVNLPYLLRSSGAPLLSSERGPEWPPLILGGSNAAAAHALVDTTGDCFADAIFFGEGEGSVGRIARLFADSTGAPKRERIEMIANQVRGFWASGSLARSVEKARAPEGAGSPVWGAMPLLPGDEAGTVRLAITHGCPCLCTFCFEGFDRAPFRQVPAAEILQSARELKRATGADTVEIESFNFNTHTELGTVLAGLHRIYHRVNMMSQRVDILAQTPGLLDLEIAADKHAFTLGIEGISENLRRFLHKSLPERDIHRVLEALHARKTREIKLFYLLTGRESASDFEEFASFLKWLKSLRQRSAASPRVVFSFGFLVRMPLTPLRHDPPILIEQAWRAPAGTAKSLCETHGFEYRLAFSWPEYAATQAFAIGGHETAGLVAALSREGSIEERGLTAEARRLVEEWIGAHAVSLLGEKPFEHPFGFPFLNDPITRAHLHGRYLEAVNGHDNGYCRRGTVGMAACDDCPGCTRVPARRARQTASLGEAARAMTRLIEGKRQLVPVLARAQIPREAAGMGEQWAEAFLMRRFIASHPDELENLLSVHGSIIETSGILGRETPWYGETVVTLTAWDREALQRHIAEDRGPFTRGLERARPSGELAIARIRVTLPTEYFPDPASSLAAFLRDAHAPVTIRRATDGMHFVVPEKSIKKRMLRDGLCSATATHSVMNLTIGPHPFLGAWLSSFSDPHAARRAMIEVIGLE
jgi:hypothetical protein